MSHPIKDVIANAQNAYAAEQSTRNLTALLQAVSNIMQEGAEILIPVVPNAAGGQISILTHTAEDDLVYAAAYSSAEAADGCDTANTLARPLINYCEAILQMEGIAGIVFNPQSPAPVTLQKKMLRELLQNAQQQPLKSGVSLWRGDITTLDCDVIVNAANSSLLGGGGVDGAIHRTAGSQLLAECKALNGCRTGEAKITFGYNLPARYVIHTVGPIYAGKVSQRLELADCYRNSLNLARGYHLHSIAFPAISTGAYGYPKEEAARIALLTVTQWLNDNPDYAMKIILTCYNSAVYKAYQELIDAAKHGELA